MFVKAGKLEPAYTVRQHIEQAVTMTQHFYPQDKGNESLDTDR